VCARTPSLNAGTGAPSNLGSGEKSYRHLTQDAAVAILSIGCVLLVLKQKQTRNVWSISLTPKSEKWAGVHPTQKPEELLRRIIISCTDFGDTILDPFTGSGTTNVMALKYNRNSIGIEKDKKCLSIIKKRMEKEIKGTLREADMICEE